MDTNIVPVGYYEGIGGSVSAAIMGLDKRKSPYDVWLNFVDPSTREDLSDNEAVLWGTILERPVGLEAARRLGLRVEWQPGLVKHPVVPCMQAHVDFTVKGEPAILECKARGLHMLKQYDLDTEELADEDRVLPVEALQVHHYLAVTGAKRGYLAVLIGGQRLLTFVIERDPAIIATLEAKCVEFWRHVQTRTPPPPINVADCAKLWPSHLAGSSAEASDELFHVVERRRQLKASLKEAETELDYLDLRVKSAMQSAEELRYKGKALLSWKSQSREHFELERFRTEHPDLAAAFTEKKTMRVMREKAK